MPKISHVKIKNKPGKHAQTYKVLAIPKTNMDIIQHNDTPGYTYSPGAVLNGGDILLGYKSKNIKTAAGVTHTVLKHKPSLIYDFSFNNYKSLDKFLNSVSDEILNFFTDKNLTILNRNVLLGYGDEIKVNANNIFQKGKKYSIEFFRKPDPQMQQSSGSKYQRVGAPSTWSQSSYNGYKWMANQSYYIKAAFSHMGISTYYSPGGEGYHEYSYPNNGDVNAYKLFDIVKSIDSTINYNDFYGFLGESYAPAFIMLDPSRSFLRANIRIGYEFTYTDSTKEIFLTNNDNIQNYQSYNIGRFRINFTPSKDILSVKFVIKLEGDFDYGKIFGNLKDLINNHYPTLTSHYRNIIKNSFNKLDNIIYRPDSSFTTLEAYYNYFDTNYNPTGYSKNIRGFDIAEINPSTGKVRERISPLFLEDTNTLATEYMSCGLGIYNIALYECNDENTIIDLVNPTPIISMASSNGATPIDIKINDVSKNDNLLNLNLKGEAYPILFKNLKTKQNVKHINNINSFLLKDDLAGPAITSIKDYVFKYFLDTIYSYGSNSYIWWEIDNGVAEQLHYAMNKISLLSYEDIIFDKNKHRYMHLFLENMNIPNKSSIGIRIEFFFSEASRHHKGILTKHKSIAYVGLSNTNKHAVVDCTGRYVTHTWEPYGRWDDESKLLEEIDVPSFRIDSYSRWSSGSLLDLMHGHKVRMCVFIDNVDTNLLTKQHKLDLAVTLSPYEYIPLSNYKQEETVNDIELIYEQQELRDYDDYLENTCEPYIYIPEPPTTESPWITLPNGGSTKFSITDFFYYKYSANLEYYISGDKENWYPAKILREDLGTSNKMHVALTYSNITVQATDVKYKSLDFNPNYKAEYRSEENQEEHTLDMSFTDGVYEYKRYPDIFKESIGSLADTFKSFKSLYVELIEYSIVNDIHEKHEWFRLFGDTRETDIKKIVLFKRNNKNSLVLINGVPVEFTPNKLLEYNDQEFIAVYDILNVFELSILYSEDISRNNELPGIYIDNKGLINFERNGIRIHHSKNYLVLQAGLHKIPKNYVCSDNMVAWTGSKKVKILESRVNILNKYVIVPTGTTIYIPIKESKSMFDGLSSVYESYERLVDYGNPNGFISGLLGLHNQIYSIPNTQGKDFYDNTYLYPNINSLLDINPNMSISADVESFLYKSKECQRNFVIHESASDMVVYKENPFDLDIHMPKLIIPYSNPKNYKPVLFMNGLLMTASPEVIKKGSNDYIIVDLCEVYSKSYEEFNYSYSDCVEWYRKNKVSWKNDHIFEVELYTDDTKIIDTKCTTNNDNFIPIPIDFLENISTKSDYCFEVYLDGRLLHPYYYKLGLYGTSIDLQDKLDIPAIYFMKTMTDKLSVGSNVVIIKKKNIRITSYDISSASNPVIFNNKFTKYSKFYYLNGRKVPEDRLIRVTDNVIIFKDLLHNRYTKSYTNMSTFTGSPFIIASNEMYDETNSIDHHFKFSTDIYSYISGNINLLESWIYPTTRNEKYEAIATLDPIDYYLGLVNDKKGSFMTDSEFEFYMFACRNSLRDNLVIPSQYTSRLPGRISPSVYKQISGAISYDDLDIKKKVSYIYSLITANLLNSRDMNRYSETLIDILTEDDEIRQNKTIVVDEIVLAKYNFTLTNHLGKVSNLTKESFIPEALVNTNDVLTRYSDLTFIPVSYGIIPKEWYWREDNYKDAIENTYRDGNQR